MQISKQLIDRFRHNPDQYDEEVLKHKPWSKEKEILQAVGKYQKVAIGSGNIVGKTYTLSDLVLWFAPLFPQSKIITTAPTERQVKDQLWSEISKKHSEVKDVIGGRLTMKRLDFGEDWFAVGFKCQDYSPERFHGYHSSTGYILILFDEASGIKKEIWDAAQSMMAGRFVRWVVAGNRLDPLSKFEKCFTSEEWHPIIISSLESPNITGERYIPGLATKEWVESCKHEYGEGSPLYMARVLGQCPHEGLDTLIPLYYLENIKKLKSEIKSEGNLYGGLDVAASGADMTVLHILDSKGQHIDRYVWSKLKTTETEGRAKKIFKEVGLRKMVVDADGLGLGVYQGLADDLPGHIIPYHGSNKPNNEAYNNRRTEIWNWVLKDLESGEISAIQDNGYLFADLSGIKCRINRQGKLQLEAKDEYKKRLGHSPDDGDAFVMANMARKYGTMNYEEKKERKEEKLPEQFTLAEFDSDLGEFE